MLPMMELREGHIWGTEIYNAFHRSHLKSYRSETRACKLFREKKMDIQHQNVCIERLDYSASFDSVISIHLVSFCVFTIIRLFASSCMLHYEWQL